MRSAHLVALALCLAGSVSGCRDTRLGNGGCQKDSDCGSPAEAFRCELQTGQCYCRTDVACPPRQFCNTSGFCQERSGCERNADCLDPSLFCDTTTGTCLSFGRCSSDLQCELGQVCDGKRSTCVPGCRSSGDCPGSSCLCGTKACNCTGTTPAEVAACPIGVCDSEFCADPNFCRFGEQCGLPPDAGVRDDGGVPLNRCFSDFDPDRKPYCANCSFGGGISVCGNGPNYCLIDTTNPGNFYCGVDCGEGQACPRGYGCQDVIVVYTQNACSRSAPACPANPSLPCTQDSDCKRGGSCAKPSGAATGFCVGVCAVGEGDSQGFCSCQVDADCAQETCGSGGECSISRRKCVNDGDCRTIRCVDFDGIGGCLIGQNCAPDNGLSCVQVR